MMAPTAMSALPSLESQLANITGKTPLPSLARGARGLVLMLSLLPFSMISHDLARVLHSPGQNLTKWSDEMTGLCTSIVV